MNLWTIFITGLTTGGLSCLAMQGGILASAIANQKEDELADAESERSSKRKKEQPFNINPGSFDQLDWLPVSMFLTGKLISHTLFGFLLGFLGSRLELSLSLRLFFQGLAAFFMFATAMNLLNVHPIFRYVLFQPPKFFTRLIKNTTKSKAVFTPFLIGFLTLLIPCGVTQSMEVLAITSGSSVIGAVTMFVFVLGTSPLFSLVGVGMAKFSEFWKGSFLKIAAVSLIFLALSGVNGVLVVLDSPYTWQKIANAFWNPAGVASSELTSQTELTDGYQEVIINILSTGYSPNKIRVKSGIPVRFTLQTEDAFTCASDFIFPAFNIRARLKSTDKQSFIFTPEEKGRYTFSCTMGMYSGVLEVI